MGITSIVLSLGIIIAFISGWVIKSWSEMQWIHRRRLVSVNGIANRYPNLLLGNYGIPTEVGRHNGLMKVRVVFPRINDRGNLEYIHSWHRWSEVKRAYQRAKRPGTDLSHAVAIAPIIQEHLRIEEELKQLYQQSDQIANLADLVSTSDFYSTQSSVYERALEQIDSLIDRAKRLEQIYIRIIRETLIGVKVTQYNPDELSSSPLALDDQYEQTKAAYWQLKNQTQSYLELTRDRPVKS
jgi:hypothetical protein